MSSLGWRWWMPQLHILELRGQAEQSLGDDFDIRRFHDALLAAGSIPLDALEQRMDKWLAAEMAAIAR